MTPTARPEIPALTDRQLQSLKRRGFTPEGIDRARRFQRPVAALLGYVDVQGGIRTSQGQGTLLQAFSDGRLVLLTRGRPTAHYPRGGSYVPMIEVPVEEVSPA